MSNTTGLCHGQLKAVLKELLCEDNKVYSNFCSCVSVRWCFIELV